jgi:hypothetical protein
MKCSATLFPLKTSSTGEEKKRAAEDCLFRPAADRVDFAHQKLTRFATGCARTSALVPIVCGRVDPLAAVMNMIRRYAGFSALLAQPIWLFVTLKTDPAFDACLMNPGA